MDRMFFGQCISGLRSIPFMTRLLLASPHHKDAHSRPFGPLQNKTSMNRYHTYWKFFCYCLRVVELDEAELAEQHGFGFTPRQLESLGSLQELLRDDAVGGELEGELLQLSASFWMQQLEGDLFDSPLWHFIGVLGIDGDTKQFRPAPLHLRPRWIYIRWAGQCLANRPFPRRRGLV